MNITLDPTRHAAPQVVEALRAAIISMKLAPGIALVLFTGMFLVSSLVVGPLISGTDDNPSQEQDLDHAQHHE